MGGMWSRLNNELPVPLSILMLRWLHCHHFHQQTLFRHLTRDRQGSDFDRTSWPIFLIPPSVGSPKRLWGLFDVLNSTSTLFG